MTIIELNGKLVALFPMEEKVVDWTLLFFPFALDQASIKAKAEYHAYNDKGEKAVAVQIWSAEPVLKKDENLQKIIGMVDLHRQYLLALIKQ